MRMCKFPIALKYFVVSRRLQLQKNVQNYCSFRLFISSAEHNVKVIEDLMTGEVDAVLAFATPDFRMYVDSD